jgi:hypothetical protein
LDADTLTRLSYLVGIFKALNILYSEALADAWIQRPNANRIFGGQTPLAYMIKGGLPALQVVPNGVAQSRQFFSVTRETSKSVGSLLSGAYSRKSES